MKIARHIGVRPWMQGAAASVLALLDDGADTPQALFVGGCVRNALLDVDVGDVDIATAHEPDKTADILNRAGIKTVPTGIAHGTITALCAGRTFEITSLRADIETFGRHAVVSYTKDWKVDAQRRDFTINTLLADAAGNVYDPLGQGLDDLDARRVVFVGDPARRIAEDYLRILRFFRFYGYYGQGAPDPAAIDACRAAATQVRSLSRERITQEWLKILALSDAEAVLSLVFSCDILTDLPHGAYRPDILKALAGIQETCDRIDCLMRLCVIAGMDSGHIPVLERYMVFSRARTAHIRSLMAACRDLRGLSGKDYRLCAYHYGHDATLQAFLFKIVIQGDKAVDSCADYQALAAHPPDIPVFPLNGRDLAALGVPQGKDVGRILKNIEQWWIENDFNPGRDACLTRAESLVQEGSGIQG